MKKTLLTIGYCLLTILMVLTTACKKTGPVGAMGAQGPAGNSTLTGNIQGRVVLYDDANNKITSPATLVGDTVIAINNATGVIYKAITSVTGTYTLTNLSAGTYSFVVSKIGYGTTKAFAVEFVGGGTIYENFNIAQTPTTNVTAAQPTTTGTTVAISYTVPSSVENIYTVTYVSIPGNNFVNGILGNYSNYDGRTVVSGSTTSVASFSSTMFYSSGFTSGSTVYFATYIVGQNSYYVDPITGNGVYTALSSTPVVVSAIVP